MWGGSLDETNILHQSEFMGWILEDTSFTQTRFTMVHVGVGAWMRHTFSTSQNSTLVLMGWDLEDTSISLTRFTMVHVGWVVG